MNLVGSSAGVLEGKVVLLSANNELRLSVATCSELNSFRCSRCDFYSDAAVQCWALSDQPAPRVAFELNVHPDL